MKPIDKIELCKKYPILIGRNYSSWDLDPQMEAMLIAADIDGDFVLRDSNNVEWVGSFADFLHQWDVVTLDS